MDNKTKKILMLVQQRLKSEGKPFSVEDAIQYLANEKSASLVTPKKAEDELVHMLNELNANAFPEAPAYPKGPFYSAQPPEHFGLPPNAQQYAPQQPQWQQPPQYAQQAPSYVPPLDPVKQFGAREARVKLRQHCTTLTVASVLGVVVGGASYVSPLVAAGLGVLSTVAAVVYVKRLQGEIQYLETTYRLDPRA